MKVVPFTNTPSLTEAAEVVSKFEHDLIDGKIVGFFIAAVGPNDETYAYTSATRPVSRLRLGGAMQHALHCFNHEEDTHE